MGKFFGSKKTPPKKFNESEAAAPLSGKIDSASAAHENYMRQASGDRERDQERANRIRGALERSGFASREMLNELVPAGESATTLQNAVVKTGLVSSQADLIEIMAADMGFEVVRLKNQPVSEEMIVASGVTESDAKRYTVFPIEANDFEVLIAIADPMAINTLQALEFRLQPRHVRLVVAREDEIKTYIQRYYDKSGIDDQYREFEVKAEQERTPDRAGGAGGAGGAVQIDENSQKTNPIVKFVDLIFKQAVADRASDIHIEPTKNTVKIRFRIDGVLQDVPSPPKKWQNMIVSRLKVLSGMDLAEKRIPQDGRIKLTLPDKKLDLRVSTMPALHGETIVMRLLDQSNVLMGLEDVGFLPDTIKEFEGLIRSPNGIILVTGPTGSGKTTTLYSALSTINDAETKIITIEHPVEYMLDGINQVQVNHEVGLDFALGLRTMLRQSPDVIMVGEIRDLETAEIAIRAALTGHLVFSTLHTNDAPSSTTRLVDMGVKPFMVASAIQAVIAQRLVRRICSVCKTTFTPDPAIFGPFEVDANKYRDTPFFKGDGCERCNNSGYRGRTAIHEIFKMTAELRQMVIRSESASKLKKVAVSKFGMRSLRRDGFEKICLGQTTFEEIGRITQED
jgi:type II secretory ATPase GspE/PulE/Tfp pilus assembly ATPase PilB-like protein